MAGNRPPIEELPYRARVGYVCKYGQMTQGDLTPGVVLGVLGAKGLLDDVDLDREGARQVAAEVVANFGGVADE